MKGLEKRYGLMTAICMVVGIVIGSGVFFKAQDVLTETNGKMWDGVLAWIIGGAIMVVLASTFAVLATKYEKVGGLVDYAEATCGKTFAYYVGWFMSTIYFPAMTSVLAWVSARYTMVAVFGVSSDSVEALCSAQCITIAVFYLVLIYFINAIAPKLAGKLQVSTTIIKLIPLAFIAIVGTIIGACNGTLAGNMAFEGVSVQEGGTGNGFFAAVCCTAFAYEGWIIATSINAEIKDSKKNLPLALLIGSVIVVAVYLLYYIGVLGLQESGLLVQEGTSAAFRFFGDAMAVVINFFIIISCLGTLNGLMTALTRSTYALSVRGMGFSPKVFSRVDGETNMPNNSAALGLLMCVLWFVYFIGGQFFGWFGAYAFDSSELPIITLYPMYFPILVSYMVKEKQLGVFKRFILPSLSIVGIGAMVAASIFRHGLSIVWYLIVFAVIMGLGAIVYFRGKKNMVGTEELFDDLQKEALEGSQEAVQEELQK